jgi:hypothetical protein
MSDFFDRGTEAADEREKTSDSQKIMRDIRKLARYLRDNKSSLSKIFQRRKFVGSGSTSVFEQ